MEHGEGSSQQSQELLVRDLLHIVLAELRGTQQLMEKLEGRMTGMEGHMTSIGEELVLGIHTSRVLNSLDWLLFFYVFFFVYLVFGIGGVFNSLLPFSWCYLVMYLTPIFRVLWFSCFNRILSRALHSRY